MTQLSFKHVLTVALLAIGVYLKSPLTAISAVILHALSVVEAVFSKQNRDADITALVARAEAYEKRMKILESDVTNVAERAKSILGEVY